LRFQPGITHLIAALAGLKVMTLAVKFDDQSRRVTGEVGNITSYRDLPAEAQAINVVRLEITP
jgi:hypothetical protein